MNMGAATKNEIIGEVINAVFIICFFIVKKLKICRPLNFGQNGVKI
jgi:hypothetical protein